MSGRIILWCMLEGHASGSGGLLWTRSWTFGFRERRGISWLAEWLLAAKGLLPGVSLVGWLVAWELCSTSLSIILVVWYYFRFPWHLKCCNIPAQFHTCVYVFSVLGHFVYDTLPRLSYYVYVLYCLFRTVFVPHMHRSGAPHIDISKCH
jgi:hypothetical protein